MYDSFDQKVASFTQTVRPNNAPTNLSILKHTKQNEQQKWKNSVLPA